MNHYGGPVLSRSRVHPFDVTKDIILVPDDDPNTFGAWTEVIPANLIPFDYILESLVILKLSGADSFVIQMAINATPSEIDYLGETKFNLGAASINHQVAFDFPQVPAYSPVYGRLKTGAGGSTINFSVSYRRFISRPIQ